MSFNVKTISVFEHQAKRLMKKFPSLKKEIQTLISELKEEPEKGTSKGHNCYKIRLSIYDKSDIENLTDKEILELIKRIP